MRKAIRVSEDLGTWSRPQAAALVKVLKRAGVRARTTATADGDVTVTVPPGQSQRAHDAIAANMDSIARVARQERESRGATVSRLEPRRRRRGRETTGERPLVTERLRRVAPAIAIAIAVLLVLSVLPATLALPTMLVVVLGAAYLLGRRDGPGGG